MATRVPLAEVTNQRTLRKTVKKDKIANRLEAIEYLEKAQNYEEMGNFGEALRYYENARDYLPNEKITNKIKAMKTRVDSSFKESCLHRQNDRMNDFNQEIKTILSQTNFALPERNSSQIIDYGSNDHEIDSIIESDETNNKEYSYDLSLPQEASEINLDNNPFDSRRQSTQSCVSDGSTESDQVDMIATLQHKTLAALEYQLLHWLNFGTFSELMKLRMIGKKRAERICTLRDAHSTSSLFSSMSDLEKIGMRERECHKFLSSNALVLLNLAEPKKKK